MGYTRGLMFNAEAVRQGDAEIIESLLSEQVSSILHYL